ncbi:hypothetical protein, partial [uncultured Oscillibacter sp.]|uniref:hypothetical protein n=1 Tax=uncultured Oscillibacter sp. TaxID=876091 RepID=UPI0025F8E2C5
MLPWNQGKINVYIANIFEQFMNEIPGKRMGCKQIVKLGGIGLTFRPVLGIMNSTSRNACKPGNIFPLLSLYHTGKR